MAEFEFAGMTFKGGKMAIVLTALSTLGGASWAAFEIYKDYMDMKEQIQNYVAPDLSEFDKNLALIKEEMVMTREEVGIIKDAIGEQVDFMRDAKHDLRGDLVRMEKILDKVENDIDKVEDEAQALMDRTKKDARIMIDDASNRFNDKVSGMEGYVKRELGNLEKNLDIKLQKSLDNPLANR